MKPKKVAFYGLFGQQNIGNDCTLQAILYHVREHLPDAELICICSGPEEISARHNIQAFPIRRDSKKSSSMISNPLFRLLRKIFILVPIELMHWVKALQILKDIHMLVVPGTGLLVDYSTTPFGYPYHVFAWSMAAKLCRCKLLFVSVGAGPLYHPLSRWFIKFALSLADYRSYRDSFSRQYIENIGFKAGSDPVYPDLAFSLPTAMMPARNDRNRQRSDIGVGIMDYYGIGSVRQRIEPEAIYRDYLNKIDTFVTWLYEDKYTVRVLIGDVKYDSNVRQDLLELLEKRGLKTEDGPIINEPILTVEHLLSKLAKTDVVVSPRFHNIILALMLNIPVISISYNEKFDSLMAEFGLADYCQPIEHLDIEILIEQFKKIEKNAKNLKPCIKKKTEEYRRTLYKQYAIIFNYF